MPVPAAPDTWPFPGLGSALSKGRPVEQRHGGDPAADTSRAGAGIGFLAAALFLVASVVFLTTSPTGSPGVPDVGDARFAPAHLAENLDAVRISTLLTALGTTLFLWFLAHLWATLRPAEPAPAQGSVTVLVGGVAGSVLVLTGLALTATSGLSTTTDQTVNVSPLYVASALLTAFGGGVYSVFFFGLAKVILRTGAMARWLGRLAVVVWLILASGAMALGERRRTQAAPAAPGTAEVA